MPKLTAKQQEVVNLEKLTRFEDIPQFTECGQWECDFDLTRVWPFIEEQQKQQGLDIDPDFQRVHVWTEAQQVAWIEFFLRGGKTGRVLYFNKPSWNRWNRTKHKKYDDFVLVDGKQRLEAIRRFVHNEIQVFGSYFHEYTDSPRLIRTTIRINVNDLQTKEQVLQWYIEMNTGGTPHTEAEIEKVRRMLQEPAALAAFNEKEGE